MTQLARSAGLLILVLGLGGTISFARESEGSRANPVLVNGKGEFAVGDGTEGAEFWVCASGSNAAAGSKEAPVASLHRARDAVREARSAGKAPGSVTVWVKGGVYPLRNDRPTVAIQLRMADGRDVPRWLVADTSAGTSRASVVAAFVAHQLLARVQ